MATFDATSRALHPWHLPPTARSEMTSTCPRVPEVGAPSAGVLRVGVDVAHRVAAPHERVADSVDGSFAHVLAVYTSPRKPNDIVVQSAALMAFEICRHPRVPGHGTTLPRVLSTGIGTYRAIRQYAGLPFPQPTR